jgi:hypothetical protein
MSLGLEQFVTAEALAGFERRQAHTLEAIGVLGMDGVAHGEHPATAFGGGAFALQGLDTYLPGPTRFDLDAVVTPAMFTRFRKEKRLYDGVHRIGPDLYMGTIASKDVPLPVDVFTSDGSDPHALDVFLTLRPMADVVIPTHKIAGIHVVDPVGAALAKVGGIVPRVKDAGSILKAHFVGKHSEHPITTDPGWQDGVALAKRLATSGEVDTPLWRKLLRIRPQYPSWLNELVDTDFDHPAFRG